MTDIVDRHLYVIGEITAASAAAELTSQGRVVAADLP